MTIKPDTPTPLLTAPKTWQIPKHHQLIFAAKRKDYCLCVPVINEGQRFQKQLRSLQPYAKYVDIIVLDGGSTDGSIDPEFLQRHAVRAVLIKHDSGKLSAQLRMGYAFALLQGYQGIITMDGNGKDSPEALPLFIAKLQAGYAYVQGSRFIPGGHEQHTPIIRYIANRYFHAPLLRLSSGSPLTDTTNGFRAYSREYLLDPGVQPFRQIFQSYELLAYLSVRAGQLKKKVIEVPVSRVYPRNSVPTKISFISGNLDLLRTLFRVLIGRFNPPT